MAEDDLDRTLRAAGLDPETLGQLDPDASIVPPPRETETHPVCKLPELVGEAQLEMGAPIGRGAFGVVSTAVQVALNRQVAVKALRPEKKEGQALAALLREGRVLGCLEHPNIVPVHMMGTDDTRSPVIVMKRVEGTPWKRYLRRDGTLECPEGVLDPLDWHLRVLMQVCNAAHFAHRQGIIHRDIKTSNVMIGAFGEVYLLDWGLAGSEQGAPALGLPALGDDPRVAGTPGYMSPEMAAGATELIDPRTDVYLLGACLHCILTGRPPHDAKGVKGRLAQALKSEPHDYGAATPEGLAAIAHRALQREREARYPSAKALHDALADYMTHRHSRHLSREAARHLIDLRRLVDDPRAPDARVQQVAGETRFGFRAALQEWPDNTAARAGQRNALELMAEYSLAQGDPKAARRHLEEHDQPPPQMEREVTAALAHAEAREADYEALRYDTDINVGRKTRAAMMLWMGAIWGVTWIALGSLHRSGIITMTLGLGLATQLFHLVLLLVAQRLLRHRLALTAVGRSFVNGTRVGSIGTLLSWPYAFMTGLSLPDTLALVLLGGGCTGAAVASFVDKRLYAVAGVFFAGFVAIALLPTYAMEITGLSMFGGFGLGSRMWQWDSAP